jgi:hypothetical protein
MASPLKLRLRTASATGGGTGIIGGASGDPIPPEYFGMHIGKQGPTSIWGDYSAAAAAAYQETPWPNIGIGAMRLWDTNGGIWRNIERTQGNFSWARLDYAVASAEANGAKIVYNLGGPPDWATTLPGQMPGLYVGYNPHPPSNMAYWTNWCTAVATRYAGKGFTYEIWNEVNDQSYGAGVAGSGFSGTLAQLLQLSQLARQAILAVDPTAKIMTPNFVGHDGMVTVSAGNLSLEAYLAAGGGDFADIISARGNPATGTDDQGHLRTVWPGIETHLEY